MSTLANSIVGTVSFQSNDRMDVFHVLQIVNNGLQPSDEELMKIENTQFESDRAWVTGYIPGFLPVDVDGDTTVIHAWFKAESFDKSFALRIYIEFEEAEVVIGTTERSCEDQEKPKEIFL